MMDLSFDSNTGMLIQYLGGGVLSLMDDRVCIVNFYFVWNFVVYVSLN